MDHTSLKVFIAVADTRSFSRAAELMFITQPAVSKRIKALEEFLDTRLIDRSGHTALLTAQGAELYKRARIILSEIEDAKKAIDNLSTNIAGTLSMGTSHHIGLHRLPVLLQQYIKSYPDVRPQISFIGSEEVYSDVVQGSLDLGIVTLPPNDTPDIERVSLWNDPLEFVIGRDHLLAKKSDVSLEDLVDITAILPAKNTFTRSLVEDIFVEEGLSIDINIETNYLETIKKMVSIGLGWSVLPRTMLDPSVCRIPIDYKIKRSLGVVYSKNRTLSNAARAMLELLKQHR
ncbi:MAG: LysR family transcriptional regulator [Gammaproteobacteria bacterium]|nr:MAG: LysR family transcriptional regulator [Gammaproteobacteria bacterium]